MLRARASPDLEILIREQWSAYCATLTASHSDNLDHSNARNTPTTSALQNSRRWRAPTAAPTCDTRDRGFVRARACDVCASCHEPRDTRDRACTTDTLRRRHRHHRIGMQDDKQHDGEQTDRQRWWTFNGRRRSSRSREQEAAAASGAHTRASTHLGGEARFERLEQRCRATKKQQQQRREWRAAAAAAARRQTERAEQQRRQQCERRGLGRVFSSLSLSATERGASASLSVSLPRRNQTLLQPLFRALLYLPPLAQPTCGAVRSPPTTLRGRVVRIGVGGSCAKLRAGPASGLGPRRSVAGTFADGGGRWAASRAPYLRRYALRSRGSRWACRWGSPGSRRCALGYPSVCSIDGRSRTNRHLLGCAVVVAMKPLAVVVARAWQSSCGIADAPRARSEPELRANVESRSKHDEESRPVLVFIL